MAIPITSLFFLQLIFWASWVCTCYRHVCAYVCISVLICIHTCMETNGQVTSAIQLFTFSLYARLCRHTQAMVRMWRSEDTFQELLPAFHLVEVRSLLWFLPSFLQPGYQAHEVPSNPPVSGSLSPCQSAGIAISHLPVNLSQGSLSS